MYLPQLFTGALAALAGRSSSAITDNALATRSTAAAAYQPWVLSGLWTGSPAKGTPYYILSFAVTEPNTIYIEPELPGAYSPGQVTHFPPSNASCYITWPYDDLPIGKTFNCTSSVDTAHWSFQISYGDKMESSQDLVSLFNLRVTLVDSKKPTNGLMSPAKVFHADASFKSGVNLQPECAVTCEYQLIPQTLALNQMEAD
jgi:hypothetical protein